MTDYRHALMIILVMGTNGKIRESLNGRTGSGRSGKRFPKAVCREDKRDSGPPGRKLISCRIAHIDRLIYMVSLHNQPDIIGFWLSCPAGFLKVAKIAPQFVGFQKGGHISGLTVAHNHQRKLFLKRGQCLFNTVIEPSSSLSKGQHLLLAAQVHNRVSLRYGFPGKEQRADLLHSLSHQPTKIGWCQAQGNAWTLCKHFVPNAERLSCRVP